MTQRCLGWLRRGFCEEAGKAEAAGVQYSGTRRIVSPERIEFHAKTTKADGSVLSESGGYYKRIGP